MVKDYYLAHRPGVQSANVLGIATVDGETLTNATDYTNQIEQPIIDWYASNPTKRPRYIVAFMDVPTRIYEPGVIVTGISSCLTNRIVPMTRRLPFITYINMGQRYSDVAGATNRIEDALHYIDKLARFGSNYSPGRVVISASAGGYGNDYYLLDDEMRYYPDIHTNVDWGQPRAGELLLPAYQALLQCGVSSNHIDYFASVPSTNVVTRYGTNLAGYMNWGHYGWDRNYAFNGNVRFHGNSEWFIIATVESYNGMLEKNYSPHGDYGEWFSPIAFYRSNYEATPIGAVCHVEEPLGFGVQDPGIYFGLWSRGRYFSICAWRSARTPRLLVVGDPLVIK